MNVTDVRLNWLDYLVMLLVIVGALNWGLVGLGGFANANWNVVDLIFGSISSLEDLIYVVVGLAGLYAIYMAYQLYEAA